MVSSLDFIQLSDSLSKYFFDISVECPYGQPHTATYRQSIFGSLPDELIEYFWSKGYRRNGNTIYSMNCQGCDACVPLRLIPKEFKPNRNQKRVHRRNQDLDVTVGPVEVTDEKLALCDKFLDARYPGRGSSAKDYYAGFFLNTVTSTFEVCYRYHDQLIGVALVDITANSLNAVYFYFDPDEGDRSPGTFNVLYLIELCKQKQISFLYLGYLIKEVAAMSYKENFKPHHLLINGQWSPACNSNGNKK